MSGEPSCKRATLLQLTKANTFTISYNKPLSSLPILFPFLLLFQTHSRALAALLNPLLSQLHFLNHTTSPTSFPNQLLLLPSSLHALQPISLPQGLTRQYTKIKELKHNIIHKATITLFLCFCPEALTILQSQPSKYTKSTQILANYSRFEFRWPHEMRMHNIQPLNSLIHSSRKPNIQLVNVFVYSSIHSSIHICCIMGYMLVFLLYMNQIYINSIHNLYSTC